MAVNAEIKKDILIPAVESPDAHEFCWAVNFAYTRTAGEDMVMTVVRRMSSGDDNWRQRESTNQRMLSCDNGATWNPHGPEISGGSYERKNTTLAWMHFLDPSNGLLLSLHQTSRPHPGDGAWASALHYEISRDGGRTWGPLRQIIHSESAYDEVHWMPGITDNYQYIGVDQAPFVRPDDGTIVLGFTVHPAAPDYPRKQFYVGVVFLRGRWNEDQTDLS
ncbi:MAG: sialidase family protein, partial [Candidatus Brocadiia bacterium]|nr:sialidase family protein [Candidatus Brocadiia bacterium]